jgi:hypothetical protein
MNTSFSAFIGPDPTLMNLALRPTQGRHRNPYARPWDFDISLTMMIRPSEEVA